MYDDRFQDFELAELQTLLLGLSRMRDSIWLSTTDSYRRLTSELADRIAELAPVVAAGAGSGGDIGAQLVAR
jgi:hypothetical protein